MSFVQVLFLCLIVAFGIILLAEYVVAPIVSRWLKDKSDANS